MAGIYVQDFRKASETWDQCIARMGAALNEAAVSAGRRIVGDVKVSKSEGAIHWCDLRVEVSDEAD